MDYKRNIEKIIKENGSEEKKASRSIEDRIIPVERPYDLETNKSNSYESIVTDTRITEKMLENYYTFFNNYTNEFIKKTKDQYKLFKLNVKYEHSMRVVKLMKKISESINLSEKDSLIAETTALFHDIGRFEQMMKYGTFNDLISVDHADLGVEILKKYRVIEDLDSETKNIIYKSISYHNKIEIPKKEDKKVKFFSRLIRDADKVDLFHVLITKYKIFDKNQNKDPNKVLEKSEKKEYMISEKVLSDFLKYNPINLKDVNTHADSILMRLAFLYDINFYKSFQIIKNRKYMDKFLTLIPEKVPEKEQKVIRNKISYFLKTKLKELKGKDYRYYLNLWFFSA